MPEKISREEILGVFRQTKALLEGHFQLTSGLHSPHYFQCARVLQHPAHLALFAGVIADHFRHEDIQLVISPAIGGIVVGTEVGRQLGTRTIFAERKEGIMQIRRGLEVFPGERILVVEDVVTTGGSVREVIELATKAGGVLAGVGYVVDRSNGKISFPAKSFSVLQMDVTTYKPGECPLCKQNIPITKPGSRGNS